MIESEIQMVDRASLRIPCGYIRVGTTPESKRILTLVRKQLRYIRQHHLPRRLRVKAEYLFQAQAVLDENERSISVPPVRCEDLLMSPQDRAHDIIQGRIRTPADEQAYLNGDWQEKVDELAAELTEEVTEKVTDTETAS